MKLSRLSLFLRSATTRLALTYLSIIMVMSLGFSIVLYQTSSKELGRQIPPDSLFTTSSQTQPMYQNGPQPRVNDFLRQRIDEGRDALMIRLIILNIGALVLGTGISYVLARRSLAPIEQAMEAQTQFVSDASHELRTPLTAMKTSNEVFLRRPKASIADAKALIEQNNDDIARLRSLSDALLSLAQHKRLTIRATSNSVQAIISSALTQVVPQATAKSITVEDASTALTIKGDYDLLTQALVIVLDNAIKYSGDTATVTIVTRQRGKSIYIDVKDHGIGIRASDIPHLFRRFYRADNARTGGDRGGYGLGLAIAKQITDAHNGDIEINSTVGQGSTFSLRLPAS